MNLAINPNWRDQNLKCHFCKETRSVKYKSVIIEGNEEVLINYNETHQANIKSFDDLPIIGLRATCYVPIEYVLSCEER